MDLSLFDHVKDHIQVQMGDDLMPHYPLRNSPYKIIEEKIDLSSLGKQEENSEEASRERQRKKLQLRAKNFSEGVDYFKSFKYIDIFLLKDDNNNWNYFNKPNKFEFLNLISSIESIGIIIPLIVKPIGDGNFTVLSGSSRVKALYNLYKNTGDEKYLYAPCFVIEDDIEEYFVRSLMIDVNMPYRTISKDIYVKAILERYELLKRTKAHRNEMNIAETLADEFNVSTSTIFNYLTLKNLCKEALTLISDKSLNLQSARLLSKMNLEDQLYILENVSLENLNASHKIKYLTEERRPGKKELEARVERVKTLVPFSTPVQVNTSPEMLNKFLVNVVDFKRIEIPNLSSEYARDNNHKHFSVKLNEEHMKFYKEVGLIDEELLKKVYTRNLEEIMRA